MDEHDCILEINTIDCINKRRNMDNFIKVISGILTISPIVLKIIDQLESELITNFTKELFKSKTKKKANSIFNSLVLISITLGVFVFFSPQIFSVSEPATPKAEQQQLPSAKKSDGELIYEGSKTLFEEGKGAIKGRKERDSIIIANRDKKMVYQIGSIKEDDDAILNLYMKLKSISGLNISRISVFRISRNEYFLYKDDEYAQKQINDSLANFKTEVASVEPSVKIVDLMQFCKAKEKFKERKPLKFRKQKIEIPCYYCD